MTANADTSPASGLITLALGVVAVVLVFFVLTDRPVPVVGNASGALLALGLIGVTMCALSGIGKAQSTLGWTHPITIVGSVLGVLALMVVVLPLIGVKLPLIADPRAAFLTVAIIMLVKVVLSGVERLVV